MMRRVFVTGVMVAASLLPGLVRAQGTKLWSVERYEELSRGSAEGVAIRSDGVLEAGAAASLVYTTGGGHVGAGAAGGAGEGDLGGGGGGGVEGGGVALGG